MRLRTRGAVVGLDFSSDRSRVRAVVGTQSNAPRGAAYVFETAGQGPWSPGTKLEADDPAPERGFGKSVAISAETIMVGASISNSVGIAGAAYVFAHTSGGQWLKQAKIIPPDPTYGPQDFGTSVSVSGRTAVIGAARTSCGNCAAYIYQRQAAIWNETDELLSPLPWTNPGAYGLAVAVDFETAVIAAPWADSQQGAAYVYGIPVPEPAGRLLQAAALGLLAALGRHARHDRPQATRTSRALPT